MKILLVDDKYFKPATVADTKENLNWIFNEKGALKPELRFCASFSAAQGRLERAQSGRPFDIIISDLVLPFSDNDLETRRVSRPLGFNPINPRFLMEEFRNSAESARILFRSNTDFDMATLIRYRRSCNLVGIVGREISWDSDVMYDAITHAYDMIQTPSDFRPVMYEYSSLSLR